MTTTQDAAPVTTVPDLRDIPLDALAFVPSGLAAAIALYQERIKRGTVAGRFNSNI